MGGTSRSPKEVHVIRVRADSSHDAVLIDEAAGAGGAGEPETGGYPDLDPMTQRSARVRAALTASLGLALLALPLVAQEGGARLSAFLLTEGSGAPVEGAHVILVDPGEVVLGEALSDRHGAFSLPMPAPGVYRLRITRIGYEP